LNGCDDVGISRAAADVAAHILANVGRSFGVALLDASDRRHDLARRAETALECVMLDERFLHRMQIAEVTLKTLDRRNLCVLRTCGKHEAGEDAATIDVDCAGAALPLIAAFLRAWQARMIVDCIEETRSGVEYQAAQLAIDLERQGQRSSRVNGGRFGRRPSEGRSSHQGTRRSEHRPFEKASAPRIRQIGIF
jgi:hypothetical protein